MSLKKYSNKNVLDASLDRVGYIFDNFENIIVSISGGKDSTVIAHLFLKEAHKRSRSIGLFFLDEEVVYQSTIEQIDYLMNLYPKNTNRFWLQIEFNLTNATSIEESQLIAWDSRKKNLWMHKRRHYNILNQPWSHKTTVRDKNKGFGFYDVINNFEMSFNNTAFIVGLRADESLNRYRAVSKNAGYKDIMWSTTKGKNYTFYPIYDWNTTDVWKYIGVNELKYHKYYDFLFKKGVYIPYMRVSSLIHEKSFKSICELPEFEFETYQKLQKRIKGISFAQETGNNKKMFQVKELPKNFKSWGGYKKFLLEQYPDKEKKHIFEKRFSKHLNNDYVARQQCRQLILNDYENNLPIDNDISPIEKKKKYWMEVL